ncbi:MAG: hypothetical protein FWC34_02595 [Bacteroidetes bacterium]|nr:hypothetical protein [Bacteroidota bacterium]
MYAQQQSQQAIRVNEIANEIYRQIKATFNINVLWSWGISMQKAMIYRNMPSLGLGVNGYKHKGWVIISLNEGADLYNIYLLNESQMVTQVIEDVFCEDLEILDSLIETGDMSEQEYKDKVNATYQTNY